MRARRFVLSGNRLILLLICTCFLGRAVFYAVSYPIWEGYDEWAHYAVIEREVFRGEALPKRDARVSERVEASLRLAPVAWELRSFPPPSLTEDKFWKLAPEERASRMRDFAQLPAGLSALDGARLPAYETQQPPLYYWLMSPFLALFAGAGFAQSIVLLRLTGCVLALPTILFVYLAAERIFGEAGVALGCAAVVAAMPEFGIDVSHVSNESLAAPLFAALIWLAVKASRQGVSWRAALALGIVLGAGLLAKAYFLTAIPALATIFLTMLWRGSPEERGRQAFRMAAVFAIAAALSGWWYLLNLASTGSLSGLGEAAAIPHMSGVDFLRQASHTRFLAGADAILISHLWFGGWSELTGRSWMYHVFYVVALAAFVGLLKIRFRGFEAVAILYSWFWIGLLYHVALLFIVKGVPASNGWYMYAVVAAEVTLCCGGLRALLPARFGSWVAPGGVFLFSALDLYAMHALSLPYYAGITAHRPDGSIAPLHFADLAGFGVREVVGRLGAFKEIPAPLIALNWLLYLVATVGLIGIAVRLGCTNQYRIVPVLN